MEARKEEVCIQTQTPVAFDPSAAAAAAAAAAAPVAAAAAGGLLRLSRRK